MDDALLHRRLADILRLSGLLDEAGLSEDGTPYVVADGRFYRVELTEVPLD